MRAEESGVEFEDYYGPNKQCYERKTKRLGSGTYIVFLARSSGAWYRRTCLTAFNAVVAYVGSLAKYTL